MEGAWNWKCCLAGVVLLASASFANVGGKFYSHSIAGLKLDNRSTIKAARTVVNCDDTICTFHTTYKTTSPGATFVGRFYGVRFDSVRVNQIPLTTDSANTTGGLTEANVLGEGWVFEEYPGRIGYTSVPIRAKVGSDSSFSVAGRLLPTATQRWGLAAFRGMSDIRHPALSAMRPSDNEYSVAYCFAPIQSFQGLDTVEATFTGTNNALIGKRMIYSGKIRHHTIDGDLSPVTVFKDSIPMAINYRFRSSRGSLSQLPSNFSVGGPLVFLGARKGAFQAEAGWEAGINASIFAILPSANAAFGTQGYRDFNLGLRLMSMGFSAGLVQRDFREVEWTFGGSLGVVGFEVRSNGGFLHLSM